MLLKINQQLKHSSPELGIFKEHRTGVSKLKYGLKSCPLNYIWAISFLAGCIFLWSIWRLKKTHSKINLSSIKHTLWSCMLAPICGLSSFLSSPAAPPLLNAIQHQPQKMFTITPDTDSNLIPCNCDSSSRGLPLFYEALAFTSQISCNSRYKLSLFLSRVEMLGSGVGSGLHSQAENQGQWRQPRGTATV